MAYLQILNTALYYDGRYGEMRMKNYWIGLFALLTLGFFGITAAQAGDWTTYKPGAVKAAVASGEPALLFYRTTW